MSVISLKARRRKFFQVFKKHIEFENKRFLKNVEKFTCPCCGYPSLRNYSRKEYDICSICGWEDEGQDDETENQISGPNKDYSLKEARGNFKKYLTMLRPTDNPGFEIEAEIKPKKEELIKRMNDLLSKKNEPREYFCNFSNMLFEIEKARRELVSYSFKVSIKAKNNKLK